MKKHVVVLIGEFASRNIGAMTYSCQFQLSPAQRHYKPIKNICRIEIEARKLKMVSHCHIHKTLHVCVNII